MESPSEERSTTEAIPILQRAHFVGWGLLHASTQASASVRKDAYFVRRLGIACQQAGFTPARRAALLFTRTFELFVKYGEIATGVHCLEDLRTAPEAGTYYLLDQASFLQILSGTFGLIFEG